jgi:hypothetical protein
MREDDDGEMGALDPVRRASPPFVQAGALTLRLGAVAISIVRGLLLSSTFRSEVF